jgi:hypothetical protein
MPWLSLEPSYIYEKNLYEGSCYNMLICPDNGNKKKIRMVDICHPWKCSIKARATWIFG